MEIGNPLRVVCRNSPLSIRQVEELFSALPAVTYEMLKRASFGDKNKHISLMDNIAGDFFTRELDQALLNNEADIAVHSAKDLPYPLPAGLELYCLTEAADQTDALVSKGNQTLSRLPAGARVGTSSQTRKTELLELRPDVTVVSIRGTINERLALVDNGDIDALIVATCALKRLGISHRIAEVLPFRTHPLQGHLAVVGKRERPELKTIFVALNVRNTYGKVTLVGFGPGHPDLLTIGGDKALAEADVIFHDDLTNVVFLEKYDAEKRYVGKRRGKHSHHQDQINELIYRAAVSGKKVVRLKGGDPMIFAHGREEIDFLQSRFVEVKVIPGISSGIALAACTHIPLTHRGVSSSVAFITGHPGGDVQVPEADTLVYYMGGAHISAIASKLLEVGRDPDLPAALVYNVSLPEQKVYYTSLKEMQFSVIRYPTPILVVIGNVVSFENGKGFKPDTLVTGTSCESCEASGGLENRVHTPLIQIEKTSDKTLYSIWKEGMEDFDWIIFTSRYGVRFFFEIADETGFDIRKLGKINIASVGKVTTAELNKHHIYPDVESETESAEGLITHFKQLKLTGSGILLPRSDKGLKYLSEELESLGNRVTDIAVYRNTINREALKLNITQFRKIIFSSPSGVDAFRNLYGELPIGIPLIAKGQTTKNKLKSELNETI